MKKGFFGNLISNGKKSLKFGKKCWSRLFLASLFCGALFIALETSTSGEGETQPVTHTVTFSSSSGTSLTQMAEVYVYTESGGAESVGSATQLTGSGGSFSTTVTESSSLTFFIDTNPMYNQHDPVVSWGGTIRGTSGTGIVPYAGKVLYTIGSSDTTADVSVSVSLTKNTYTITFVSGDSNYDLSERVDMYESNGNTPVQNWTSGVTVSHGDNKGFVMKPKTGYSLASAMVQLNGNSFTPSTQSETQLTLSLTNIKEDKPFTVSNISYRKYNIYFKHYENGTIIDTNMAKIVDRTTQGNINENYLLTWQSSVSFKVDLQTGYDRSTITVDVNGQTLTKDSSNYYTFTLSTAEDTTIRVRGITLNKYNSDFSLTNSAFNGQIKAFYNEYDDSYEQTESNVEFYPTKTSTSKNLLIPHDKEFKFYLQIVDTTKYNFNYNTGNVDRDITYTSGDALENIIDAASVTGVGSIVYNVNSSKNQVCITFKNVTDDVNIQIKSLNEISYTINFEAGDDIKNHMKLYKGVMMNFSNTGYFVKGDQIFGSTDDDGFITSASAVKSESYYFVVNLDDDLSADLGGVQCTLTGGSGTVGPTHYTVYSSVDFSAIKVFEITDVTSDDISVSIGGVHFSTHNVNFNIGVGEDLTATVTNYANESIIADDSSLVVDHDDTLKFKIEANDGYYLDEINKQVSVYETNNGVQGNPVSFEYAPYSDHADVTISKIEKDLNVFINLDTEKMPITFNTIEGSKYYTAVQNSDQFTVDGTTLTGIITVPYNENYCFAVKAETGYDVNSIALKNNGTAMTSVGTADGGYVVFKISSVTANINITGSISKSKYNVSFNPSAVIGTSGSTTTVTYFQDGVNIAGNTLTVQYGGSASFQVKLEDKCSQSNLEVYCTASSDELSSVNGTYTVTDVTGDMEVSVENLTINQYVINFTATDSAYYIKDDGTKITYGTQTGDYDSDYSFGVEAKTGYVIGSSMVVNCKTASGVSRSLIADATSGKYTISNIKENCTISIENVDNIMYTITLAPVDGVTYYNDTGAVISGSLKIKYGQNFEFAVGVGDAYDDSIAGMYIIVNNGLSSNVSAQKLSSGRYIVANVTEDITVKVGNITKNKYTVTLTKIEGIDYYGTSGKTITGDNEVEYKGSLTFRVYLYFAYSDSDITVMLGDNEMTCDEDGTYTIPGIDENKTITVTGVEANEEVALINKINSLSTSVSSLSDVSAVIEATKLYNNLSDEKKKNVTNIAILENLQEQVKSIHHTANSVTVDNLDWYIKLVANPISSDSDVCSRIYGKMGSEYILSLYDIYLWDTLNDKRYELPEGQTVNITFPMPDMTYFENPTGIHESSSDGKLNYVTLTLKSTTVTLSTDSFSAMGIIADRSSTPGRSSLLDAIDANVEAIKEYALTTYNSGSSSDNSSTGTTVTNSTGRTTTTTTEGTTEGSSGNISDTFKSSSNSVTLEGSALRLTLVLMIMILTAVSVWVIVKNRNKINTKNGN